MNVDNPTSWIFAGIGLSCALAAIAVPFRPLWAVHAWVALLPFQFVFLREHANINFAPSDVVAVGLIATLALTFVRRRRVPRVERGVATALSFMVPMSLSLAVGLAGGTLVAYAVANKWLGYAFLALTAAACVVVLDGNRKALGLVLRTFLIATLASAIVSVATYWLGYDYLWVWAAVQSDRLAGTLLEAPPYGGLLLVAFAIQAALLFGGRPCISRSVDWLNACVLIHAITLTFSRSVAVGFLGVAFVLAVAAVRFRRSIRPARRIAVPAVLLLIAVVTVPAAAARPTSPLFGDRGFVRARSRLFLDDMVLRRWTASLRMTQFREGLAWWQSQPILGIGLGRFLAESPRWFKQPYQIHNTYVWLLVETGIVGAVWFVILLLVVWDQFVSAIQRSADARWTPIGLAAGFAGVLGFMVGNEGLYQRHFWLMIAAAGVIGARRSNTRFRETSDPPRVLQVVTRMNVGGISQQVIVLAAALRQRGYVAGIAAGVPGAAEGDRSDAARAEGLRVERLSYLSNRLNPVRDLLAVLQLVRLFVRERPDVVHLYMLKARLLAGLAARVTGVPVVVETLHGNVLQGYYGRAASAALLLAERFCGRLLVDRVIAVTSGQRRELLEFRVATPDRIVLQLPGMDVTAFRDLSDRTGVLRERLGIGRTTLLVGTIGRLVPIKGLEVFLEAAAQVVKNERRDVRFLVAGDGPLRQELETRRDQLALRDRCTFLGEISDIRGFYADCDLVVMSSRNEGAPIVLLEAMGAGKPIVATRVGGVPDMVEDNVSALLVGPDDAEALARAILRAIQDDLLRERLGRAASQTVERFSVAAFASGSDRLYRELAVSTS